MPSGRSLYFHFIWFVSLPSYVLFNDDISCHGYLAQVKDDGIFMQNCRTCNGWGKPKYWVKKKKRPIATTYKTELRPSLWRGGQVTARPGTFLLTRAWTSHRYTVDNTIFVNSATVQYGSRLYNLLPELLGLYII